MARNIWAANGVEGFMLALYVGTLGFGIVVVGVTLVGGHGGEGGPDAPHVDLDGHAESNALEHALESAAAPLANAAHAAQAVGNLGSDLAGSLWIFRSIRFWSFGLTAFGATGTVLNCAGSDWHAPVSILMGLFAGGFAAIAFRRLGAEQVSGSTDPTELVGREARVMIAVRPGRPGKVVVTTLAGGHTELPATSSTPFEVGEAVTISAVHGGVAALSRRV